MLTFEDILRNEALEKVRRDVQDEIMEKAMEKVRREMGDEIRRQEMEKWREVQGIEQGRREVLLDQLTERFGALPADVSQRIARGTRDELTRWSKRILAATSLDDVFATS